MALLLRHITSNPELCSRSLLFRTKLTRSMRFPFFQRRQRAFSSMHMANNIPILSLDEIRPSLNTAIVDCPANVEIEITDKIGTIFFESLNSKVNVISIDMISKLTEAFESLNSNPGVKMIVLRSKKESSFFAGADINLLNTLNKETAFQLSSNYQNFIKKLLYKSKTTIAFIEGDCLGAGLELALACNHCFAFVNSKARFGFPEVTLGLIPGGLGTYLALTRCLPEPIFKILLSGKTVGVEEALDLGIINRIINESFFVPNLSPTSRQLMRYTALIDEGIPPKNTDPGNNDQTSLLAQWVTICYYRFKYFAYALKYPFVSSRITERTSGFNPATIELLYLRQLFYRTYYPGEEVANEYCRWEAKAFANLLDSRASFAYRSLYTATTNYKKSLYKDDSVLNNIRNVAIVGAGGKMGSEILRLILQSNVDNITLFDSNKEFCQKSLLGRDYQSEYPHWNQIDIDRFGNKFIFAENYDDLKSADLVIETVTEDLAIKEHILKSIQDVVSENCIIATNTSALSLSEISQKCKNPKNIIGIHYFSPVRKMKLVEIVVNKDTSKNTIDTATSFVLNQNKLPVIVKDSPGFFVTRILACVIAEIFDIYEETYPKSSIDIQLREFGFPQNMSELIDTVGLDTCLKIHTYLCSRLGERFSIMKDDNLLNFLVESGDFGKKTGSGINTYSPDGDRGVLEIPGYNFHSFIREKEPYILLHEYSQQILIRIIMRMLNECCKCLEEGVIESPKTGDLAAIYGIGFPAHTGGPFAYIDKVSASHVVSELRKCYEFRQIPAFQPCNLLLDMAKKQSKFYS